MPYQSLTLADLRTRLQQRMEAVPFWTTADANDAINEALCTWNMLTGRWTQTIVIPTTRLTYELGLPSSLVYGMRVAFNGQPLTPTAEAALDLGRPRWRTETTADGGSVPTRPTLWCPVSLQLLYIWPMDAVGANSWTLDGVMDTPQLTADGDYVNLADADISTLLGFALHVLLLKKGGPWFAQTLPLFDAFIAAAAAENSLITTSQWYRTWAGRRGRDLAPLQQQPSPVANLRANRA